jgi:hypothetical protein
MAVYRKLIARTRSTHFREVAEIAQAELPAPKEDEILVQNIYAGVNATDVNISAGRYNPDAPLPLDLGGETLGRVVEVGRGVKTFRPGDYAILTPLGGGYAEYSTQKAIRALRVNEPKPEYLSMVVSGLTASLGLYLVGEMKSDEIVLVTAAAGGTGQYAVQLAALEGNHVIGTCGSDEKAQLLRDLGCDRVINYKKESVKEVLKAEYPKGINLIYESVGKEMFDTCVNSLAILGRLVIIGYISEYMEEKPEAISQPRIYAKLLGKSASIRSMLLYHFWKYSQEHMTRLMGLYETGRLQVEIDPKEFTGLEQVADAVEYLHSGVSMGKVVVKLGD